jgi:citrate lyase beta subunit
MKNRIPNGLHLLTGLVLPKFSPAEGSRILSEIENLNDSGYCLYAMPILETKQIIQKETRLEELIGIKKVLDRHEDLMLNVRIGATDFSGLYGIRRNSDTTVYDIAVIRDCISDIINVFLRADSPYVISGPVWEYFSSKERLLKPQIRQTPFRERLGQDGIKMRTDLIDMHMDGLIREIAMDISNGLTGKTIIHPTHIRPVQALNTVTLEEYLDAKSIVYQADGKTGVMKSSYQNKMNEIKPHLYWAEKILLKSEIYGVLHEEYTYIDILQNETFTSDPQLVKR